MAQRRWRLTLSCREHHGRFAARRVLLGIRMPETIRRHVVVTGGEHLSNLSTGALLIGFHLGPPGVAVMLRVAGYDVTWMGRPRASRSWSRDAWQRLQKSEDALTILKDAGAEGGVLYRAQRLLVDGGTIYVAADGNKGREAFRVPLPGGALVIRSGWFVLRRQCRLPVLPVLTHLEGRTHVIEIHPPLPSATSDAAADLEASRAVLTPLLVGYVRRFPEQCPRLMLRSRRAATRSGARDP
jgi:lauroyl/myristoyl acyltransferase